jgi:hypothetical protein
MVAEFQHGLIRLDVVLAAIALVFGGLVLASVWMRPGIAVRRRVYESLAVGTVVAAALVACPIASASWDTSESRLSSFPRADELRLARIHAPLTIEAHLAPEDPRRFDLEHRALSKLRRTLPALRVRYVSATSIGLFEQTSASYGEIWYDLGGRQAVSRVTTAEGVLETIYSLADIAAPGHVDSDDGEPAFRGHPLAATPKGAALVFYGLWPLAVAGAAWQLGRARY